MPATTMTLCLTALCLSISIIVRPCQYEEPKETYQTSLVTYLAIFAVSLLLLVVIASILIYLFNTSTGKKPFFGAKRIEQN